MEIVFFNEQAPYFSPEIQVKLMGQFLNSDLLETCLNILKKNHCTCCFYIFLLVCTSNELGQAWLKENYERFKEIYDALPPECLTSFNVDFHEEKRLKLMKKKIKKLKRTLNSTDFSKNKPAEVSVNSPPPKEEIRSPELTVVSSKKSKRHTKALRAKMAKLKSLELCERLNLGSRITGETKPEETLQKIEEEALVEEPIITNVEETNTSLTDEQANPISWNLRKFLEQEVTDEEKIEDFLNPNASAWKKTILDLPFDHYYPAINAAIKTDKKKLFLAMRNIKVIATCGDRKDLDKDLEVIIEYLRELLQIIIFRFNYTWPHGLDADFEQDFNLTESKMGIFKRQMTLELQRNFENLIISLRCLTTSPSELLKQIYQLESKLLRFEVMHAEPLMAQLNPMEQIKVRFSHKTRESDKAILSYIEEVLNDVSDEKEDIKVEIINNEENDDKESKLEEYMDTYYEELNQMNLQSEPKDVNRIVQSKKSTMTNAWHLEKSIESILDEECDVSRAQFPTFPMSTTFISNFVPVQVFPKMQNSHDEEQREYTRWAKDIDRIQNSVDTLTILNGDIRIGNPLDKRNIISKWGHFKPVLLALSCNDIPLAVKKLPKIHPPCRRLKSLVIPLLGLRNTHILPYFACDYHENDLFLGTPLCEYNLEEYIDLMKVNHDQFKTLGLTEMDIIKQILNGLLFLHDRVEPIVHGNLKPTNVFIECNGVIKLAEFGILEALYSLTEVPEYSLIWFSNETFQIYKKSGVLHCDATSDIQVAGMLIHYILSGGCHPFGNNYDFILETFERKSFALVPQYIYKDQSVMDLLQKMLSFEPGERPNIHQVLTHVMFWSNDRKWAYILTCTGITTITPMNVKDLHDTINRSAKQVRWVDEVKKKYPLVRFFAIDNTVGLLKFIRNFYEQTIISEQDVRELKSCVLENFPTLALFLRNILENTKFHKHPAFIQFLTPDSTLVLQ